MANPSDPLSTLLDYIRTTFADAVPGDALATLEGTASALFERFELVPKHEYEAHLDILASLNAQVSELEQRLAALEQEQDA